MHRPIRESSSFPSTTQTAPARRMRRWAVVAAATTTLAVAGAAPAWADVQVPVQGCGNNAGSDVALGVAGSARADHGGNHGDCTQKQTGRRSGLVRLLRLLQGGGSCSPEGSMRVHGTGFDTCSNGQYVYRDCGPGTVSRQTGPDTVVCESPANL